MMEIPYEAVRGGRITWSPPPQWRKGGKDEGKNWGSIHAVDPGTVHRTVVTYLICHQLLNCTSILPDMQSINKSHCWCNAFSSTLLQRACGWLPYRVAVRPTTGETETSREENDFDFSSNDKIICLTGEIIVKLIISQLF